MDLLGKAKHSGNVNKASTIQSRSRAMNRLQQGTYSSEGEGIDWKYYDTLPVAASTAQMQFFTVGQGGTKTLADTNMTLNGQIPNGQHMKIDHIRLTFRSLTGVTTLAEALAIQNFLDTAVLEFTILNKSPMLQTKLSDIIGMSLMAPVSQAAGAVTSSEFGVLSATYKLKTPIILAGLTSFKCPVTITQTPDASLVGDVVTMYLGGRLVRSM
jgi:hypothetical protein